MKKHRSFVQSVGVVSTPHFSAGRHSPSKVEGGTRTDIQNRRTGVKMPLKQSLLKSIKQENDCTAYYETGLNAGDSFITALGLGFEKLIGVEINSHWTYRMHCMLRPLTQIDQVNLITGDSAIVEPEMVDKMLAGRKAIFFLDAHLDSGLDSALATPQSTCPLEYEMNMISQLARKDHVLLIDDLRILTDTKHGAWQTDEYNVPSQRFPLEKITELVKSVNPDYQMSRVTGDDRFPEDVLYCRVA